MKNQKTRLVGKDSVLAVTMKQGKNGINVQAALRTPGERVVQGAKSTHKSERSAREQFDALIEDAKGKGWTEKAGRRTGAPTFDSIPAPIASDPEKVKAQAKMKADRLKKRQESKTKKASRR